MYEGENMISLHTSVLASSLESLSDEDAEVEELGKLFAAYASTKEKLLKKSKDNFTRKYNEVKSKFNELENENNELKKEVKQLQKKLDNSVKQQNKHLKILEEKNDIIENLTEDVNNEKQKSKELQQKISMLTKQVETKKNEFQMPRLPSPSPSYSIFSPPSASCFDMQPFSQPVRRSSGGGGGCGCSKTKCSTMQCGCRKKGISCGSNCRCTGCVN